MGKFRIAIMENHFDFACRVIDNISSNSVFRVHCTESPDKVSPYLNWIFIQLDSDLQLISRWAYANIRARECRHD